MFFKNKGTCSNDEFQSYVKEKTMEIKPSSKSLRNVKIDVKDLEDKKKCKHNDKQKDYLELIHVILNYANYDLRMMEKQMMEKQSQIAKHQTSATRLQSPSRDKMNREIQEKTNEIHMLKKEIEELKNACENCKKIISDVPVEQPVQEDIPVPPPPMSSQSPKTKMSSRTSPRSNVRSSPSKNMMTEITNKLQTLKPVVAWKSKYTSENDQGNGRTSKSSEDLAKIMERAMGKRRQALRESKKSQNKEMDFLQDWDE